ncbi:hypothetical protein NPIL_170471 [Nephila pilipes]|uniref:Uncharacterized protein n=1 Tax=Nephila pilipes TaxID=299642 RepID=A0A8X6PTX1_NEPPI|nr:hypothetical protein NPIL_170471 [Nephila pilipes]
MAEEVCHSGTVNCGGQGHLIGGAHVWGPNRQFGDSPMQLPVQHQRVQPPVDHLRLSVSSSLTTLSDPLHNGKKKKERDLPLARVNRLHGSERTDGIIAQFRAQQHRDRSRPASVTANKSCPRVFTGGY